MRQQSTKLGAVELFRTFHLVYSCQITRYSDKKEIDNKAGNIIYTYWSTPGTFVFSKPIIFYRVHAH